MPALRFALAFLFTSLGLTLATHAHAGSPADHCVTLSATSAVFKPYRFECLAYVEHNRTHCRSAGAHSEACSTYAKFLASSGNTARCSDAPQLDATRPWCEALASRSETRCNSLKTGTVQKRACKTIVTALDALDHLNARTADLPETNPDPAPGMTRSDVEDELTATNARVEERYAGNAFDYRAADTDNAAGAADELDYTEAGNADGELDSLGYRGYDEPEAKALFPTKALCDEYVGEEYGDCSFGRAYSRDTGHPWHVVYYKDQERAQYEVSIRGGMFYGANGRLLWTTSSRHFGGAAMFIMTADGRIFVSNNQEDGKYQHSSLSRGLPVAMAGEIRVERGRLRYLSNGSGHYKPSRAYTETFVQHLRDLGVETRGVEVELALEGKFFLKR